MTGNEGPGEEGGGCVLLLFNLRVSWVALDERRDDAPVSK